MKKLKLFGIIFLFTLTAVMAQEKVKFKVEGWSCQSCANSTASALNKLDGIKDVKATFDDSSVTLTSDGSVSEEDLRKVIADLNFQAFFEGESITEPLTDIEKEGLDIEFIKGGEKLDFKAHLTNGKLTIFDFYAGWCGPCKLYSPKLERLVFENPVRLSLKKVDVVDWKSELAKQLTKQYKLPALPFTLIFDDKGKLIGRVEGNDIETVRKNIKQ